MARKLDESLNQVRDHVVRMGSLAHTMVELAVQSIHTDTHAMFEEVDRLEGQLDEMEREGNRMILELAVLMSPVAADLLFLTSTLVIIGEIERTGDDAIKLARRSSKLRVPFPEDLKELLNETDARARANFLRAIALINSYDMEQAQDLIQSDQGVDNAYKASRRALLEKMVEEPDDRRQFFRVSEIFHALEHISDHAVYIAKTLLLFYSQTSKQAHS